MHNTTVRQGYIYSSVTRFSILRLFPSGIRTVAIPLVPSFRRVYGERVVPVRTLPFRHRRSCGVVTVFSFRFSPTTLVPTLSCGRFCVLGVFGSLQLLGSLDFRFSASRLLVFHPIYLRPCFLMILTPKMCCTRIEIHLFSLVFPM